MRSISCVRLFFLIHLSAYCGRVVSLSVLPCHFLDSINITNGIVQPNKSISFAGTVYPHGQYAEIDYILNEENEQETVQKHTRGCLCKLMPCIRYCCSFGSYSVTNNDLTNDCNFDASIESYETEILDQNNSTKRVKLDQQFKIIDEKPCTALYFAEENYQLTHVRCIRNQNVQSRL